MVGYEAEASPEQFDLPKFGLDLESKSAHYCLVIRVAFFNRSFILTTLLFPLEKILFNLLPSIALCTAPTPNILSQPSTYD